MAMAEVCFEGNDGEVSWAPVGGDAYTYIFNGETTTSTSASSWPW